MQKFILHGVPLAATMEDVAPVNPAAIPRSTEARPDPRGLTTDAKRQDSKKGMDTTVLAIADQHTFCP